jgi:glycosyltransferase involved in cell wall biosynthesis
MVDVKMAILGTRGIPAAYGGFEKFAEEIAVRLVKHGVNVTVYCESSTPRETGEYLGVKLKFIRTRRFGSLATVLFDIQCLWDARCKFDIVYMLGYGAAPFCVIPRAFGKKLWLNVDGIEWQRQKWGKVARAYFQLMEWFSSWVSDVVVCDAHGIREHMVRRHSPRIPCTVIPYGASIVESTPSADVLAQWGLATRSYYLVVCRLEPENHVDTIVKGHLRSRSKKPLVVVGDAELGTDYVRALRIMECERVRFIGTIFEPHRLIALRFHAYAYYHGHSVGGTNPSLLEAMGCANLVIAHDNLFNREVLGESGRYFTTESDLPGIINEIEELSAYERDTVGKQAMQRIRECYTWERVISDYLALIRNSMLELGDRNHARR